MLITKQNLSVIIVSFKSDHIIHRCINSIDKEIEIIVVDNSNDVKFKNKIEEQYKNVKCILSFKNIGMGAGNNLGIKNTNKEFALILNPDVILDKSAIDEIIKASNELDSFGVIAPISDKTKYPNYKLDQNKNQKFNQVDPFKVKTVDGYSMLLNLKRLKDLNDFNFFDENIFLYLENDDICLRARKNNQKIYIFKNSLIDHLGASSSSIKDSYEFDLLRNWHWMWSKFYYNKKHSGFLLSTIKIFPNFISAIIKYVFYLLLFKNQKSKIYKMRLLGVINAFIGKKSFYRID